MQGNDSRLQTTGNNLGTHHGIDHHVGQAQPGQRDNPTAVVSGGKRQERQQQCSQPERQGNQPVGELNPGMHRVETVEDCIPGYGIRVDALSNGVSFEFFNVQLIHIDLIHAGRGNDAPPTGWPVRTSQAGSGDPDRCTGQDQDDYRHERDPGESVYDHNFLLTAETLFG